MPTPAPTTLRLKIYWSYSNLAMAHAAVEQRAERYRQVHFMVRARLYKGLTTGSMNIGSLLDDERIKLNAPRACAYCSTDDALTLDHLLPKHRGGAESADNSIWACRSCNSSKGARDVLVWWAATRQSSPPLLLVRRYLKLALREAEERDVLDHALDDLPALPFDPAAIPTSFPDPGQCVLWMPAAK